MSSNPNGQKDEWSSASQELFRAARSDHAPTSADRERVRRALAERIATGAGASSPASMAGHAASVMSRVLKLGFGVSLVVVATIAVKRVQEPARSEHASVVQPAAAGGVHESAVIADVAAPSDLPVRAVAPSAREVASRDESVAARTGRRGHARATAAPTMRASLPPRAAVEDDSHVVRASTGEGTAPAGLQPDREQVAERTTPAARAQESRPANSVKETASEERVVLKPAREPADERAAVPSKVEEAEEGRAEDARAELAFVRKMQAALRAGEAEDVLELSDEHAERWPHGTFVQEREGLRAIASCNTAARGAAARAKAFLAKYPRTPLGPRVREACSQQLKVPSAAISGARRAGE